MTRRRSSPACFIMLRLTWSALQANPCDWEYLPEISPVSLVSLLQRQAQRVDLHRCFAGELELGVDESREREVSATARQVAEQVAEARPIAYARRVGA